MQLAFLIAVVLSYSVLLNTEPTTVGAMPEKLLAIAALALVVVGHAWWIGQLKIHASRQFQQRWFFRQADRHAAALYLGYVFGLVVLCDFPAIVHSGWQLSGVIWGDDLVLAIGLTLPLLVSWACDAPIEAANARLKNRHAVLTLVKLIVLRARHLLILPLVPVLLATGLADAIRLYGSSQLQAWEGALCGVAMAGFVVLTPMFVRYCWPTNALPCGLRRTAIEMLLRRAGVEVAEVLCWQTGGTMANAAVAGFFPRFRFLFLTDRLLSDLSVGQILAITAHELGHCRRRHLHRLLLSVVLLASGLLLIGQCADAASIGPLSLLAVLWFWGWLLLHMRWAKQLELEADLVGCQLMADGRVSDVQVERFMAALWRLEPNPRGDWLHPSPGLREAHLKRLVGDPAKIEQFQLRLTIWAWLLCAAIVGLSLAAAISV